MTEQQIRNVMTQAFREDRERLFKVIDAMRMQSKYADKSAEIEAIAQTWRDKPSEPDFPNFTHPMSLPTYFPNPHFASRWEKDTYIADKLIRE